MKIGIFTDAYKPLISGVVVSIQVLKEMLEKQGHEVYIITSANYFLPKTTEPYIIRLKGWPLPFKTFKGFCWVFRTTKYFSQIALLNLDVIHVHTEFSIGKLGLLCAKKFKLPLVYTYHTMYYDFIKHNKFFLIKFFRNPILSYFDKLLTKFMRQADINIFPTLKVLEFVTHRYQLANNYQIIPTGINLYQFYRAQYTQKEIDCLKKQLGLMDNFVCLYVGRLSEEKEVDYLISAFIQFVGKNPHSKFLIIGDGPEKNNLQKQVIRSNLTAKIIFLGFVSYQYLGLYYQLGNVFINASLFETQGLTFIEALAASLPVVVRYDKVLENLIEHKKNGIFYHQQQELIKWLSFLYQNQKFCQQLSDQAGKSVSSYSQEIFVERMLKVYQQVIVQQKT